MYTLKNESSNCENGLWNYTLYCALHCLKKSKQPCYACSFSIFFIHNFKNYQTNQFSYAEMNTVYEYMSQTLNMIRFKS